VITAHSLVHRTTADIYEGNLQKRKTTEPTGDSLVAGQTPVRKFHESDSGLLQGVCVFK